MGGDTFHQNLYAIYTVLLYTINILVLLKLVSPHKIHTFHFSFR